MDELKLHGKTASIKIIRTYSSDNIERYWHGIWNGQMQYYKGKKGELVIWRIQTYRMDKE